MNLVQRARAAVALVFGLVSLQAGIADAQTWQWAVVDRAPDRAPVSGESRVTLSPRDVLITYSANVNDRDIPITTCRANLIDIAEVRTVNRGDQPFLFVVLKAQHAAVCGTGSQPVALVPIGADAAASSAVTSIMRACCGASPARPGPARVALATPSPTQSATTSPQARPSPVRGFVPPAMWVENEGLFAFLRIRNLDGRPLTIGSGKIVNCRDVAYGCGGLAGPVTVPPGSVVTLATLMSANPRIESTFSYRYDMTNGAARYTATGVSGKGSDGTQAAMSAEEIRSAEAAAVTGIGGHLPKQAAPAPPPPAHVAAHLLQRGSTRLGVGQRGSALVRVRVGTDGMPLNASIVSITNRALVAAALETAVSSTYAPATRFGRPQDEDYIAEFQFDGNDPSRSDIPVWRRSPLPRALPTGAASDAARVPNPTPSASASARPRPTGHSDPESS